MKLLRPLLFALTLPSLSLASGDPTVSYDDGVSGAELKALVVQTLRANGLAGEARISASRGYPACSHAPHIAPRQGDWSNLLIRCDGPRAWDRQVRSTAKSNRQTIRPRAVPAQATGPLVATLTRPLKSGAVITANDVKMAPAASGSVDGSFSDLNALIGQRLSKNLGEGRAVQARHLEKNWMITKDMPVSIQFLAGGMSISAPGISLKNGELGEMIEVRNLSSGTVLYGQIAGPQKIIVRAKTY
ncbi:MAG: flagellar basal body P-ring formation protein FlgA [Thalassovita sp.]